MSGTKISALPSDATVTLADIMPVVVLGSPNVTKQTTVGTLFAALNNATLAGPLGITAPGTVSAEVVNFGQFAPTASANGFLHNPGDVTEQWGNGSADSTGIVTVTFPYTFSASPWAVNGTAYGMTTNQAVTVGIVGTPTTTQVTFKVSSGVNGFPVAFPFYWTARGPK